MEATWIDSAKRISIRELLRQKIFYKKIPVMGYRPKLERLRKKLGYAAKDTRNFNPATPKFKVICKQFDREHLHTDDEVRYIVSGEGYFDIRSLNDHWMHIFVRSGDFLLIPANRHHLFYLSEKKRIRVVRLFKENPKWEPIYRKGGK